MAALLVLAPAAWAQDALTETLGGRWIMEDLYTVHVDDADATRIESHEIGEFVYEVEFGKDGSGRLNNRPFQWTHHLDQIQWRFADGSTASLLARFLTLDYFLVFVTVPGSPDSGAVVSGLRRVD